MTRRSNLIAGAVLTVGSQDTIFYSVAVGHYGDDDQRFVSDSTVYDLASLTKVIGLTTAVMLLVSEGSLDIDQPLSSFFPQWAEESKAEVTIRHLLTHTSGLPAWRPLHLETASRNEALDSVLAAQLESTPGTKYTCSGRSEWHGPGTARRRTGKVGSRLQRTTRGAARS